MTSAPKFASFNWMRGVSDNHHISVIYRLVLLRLCLHRDEKNGGRCDPGYDAVANELGVHRTTVMRAVDVGVRFGWFAPPIRGRRTNASFVFTFPIANQEVAYGTTSRANQEVALSELRSRSKRVKKSLKKVPYRAKSEASTEHGQRERAKRTGKKDSLALRARERDSSPPVASRDSKRSPAKKTPARGVSIAQEKSYAGSARPKPQTKLDDYFERLFWPIYPRRTGKEAARKAYAAALKRGVDPETLNEKASRYADERRGQDPKYTKSPAGWIADGRYLDEPPGPPTLDGVTGEEVAGAPPRERNKPKTWADVLAEVPEDGPLH